MSETDTQVGWEELFVAWSEARRARGDVYQRGLKEFRRRIARNSAADWEWLRDSLGDSQKKWFVADLFQNQQIPKRLLEPMIRAAVREQDASRNQWFIHPCVRSVGERRVVERLLHYLREGTNAEKAGAASAFYWATAYEPQPGSHELRDAFHLHMLLEFVSNDDIEVRRRTISMLHLRPQDYPPEAAGLVEQAISIARSHGDEYIRHRVEVQMGAGGPYLPTPKPQRVRHRSKLKEWYRRC